MQCRMMRPLLKSLSGRSNPLWCFTAKVAQQGYTTKRAQSIYNPITANLISPPHTPRASLSTAAAAPVPIFCRSCGTAMHQKVPEGDTHSRNVCPSCGYIEYQNPKMVVGVIVERDDGRLLLCKRGIEPQIGKWTVPAGYLELRESTAAGAAREAMEEANCAVHVIAPYVHFDIISIGQAYILFRATATDPEQACAGDETTAIQWVSPRNIPFEDLAFSSVALALQLYVEDLDAGRFRVHHGVIVKQPGSGPNQPGTFTLQQHISLRTTEVHVSSP